LSIFLPIRVRPSDLQAPAEGSDPSSFFFLLFFSVYQGIGVVEEGSRRMNLGVEIWDGMSFLDCPPLTNTNKEFLLRIGFQCEFLARSPGRGL